MKKNTNTLHKERLTKGEKISKYITERVGTFGCAIIFCILALISLPSVIKSGEALTIVSWLAQTFLQLVLLPIIMIGQNLQSRHAEILAEATYDNDVDMHKDVESMKQNVDNMHNDVKSIKQNVESILENVKK